MEQFFDERVRSFLEHTADHNVRMLMVGGGAVNFHGYQRSSADVDFWIETSKENLSHLLSALRKCGFDLEDFPPAVYNQDQNISIKISPIAELELITRFNPGKTFEQAEKDAVPATVDGYPLARYSVLSFEDLINSKTKAGRPKDLMDIQELKRRKDNS